MLINKDAVRRFILAEVEATREWECTCVSPVALKRIDILLQSTLKKLVQTHPSIGKTFREVL